MLTYILQVSACWGVFYLLYALVLSRTTFFSYNRAYLMLTLLISLLLPTLEWPVPELTSQAALQASYYMQPITIGVQQLEIVVTGSATDHVVAEGSAPAFSWRQAFLLLYWIGVAVAGIRLLYGMWQIFTLYRKSSKEKHPAYTQVNTPVLHTPFSFFRWLFWSRALSYPKSDAAKIVRHEQAHMDGWHSLDILIAEVLTVLFWFNPLIYLYARSLRTVHEYLADAAVLHHSKKTTYGHLLIRQSQSGQAVALANHFSHVQLKKRILMMTKKKSHRHQLLRYALTLPLLAALAFAFTLPATPAAPVKSAIYDGEGPQPVFKGCETLALEAAQQKCTTEKLMAFIQQKLKYPEAAKAAGQEGMAVVEFTVSKSGAVEDIKVLKSAGEALDQAAVAVVRQLPDWIPATDESGQPVAAKMTLPFKFKLPAADGGDEVFKVVEEMPRFPGCEDIDKADERQACANQELMLYIYENLVYPKAAKEAGVEGMPVLKLVIGKDGAITDFSITRSANEALDAEVLRVAQQMQQEITWVPGVQRGRKVNVALQLPIRFKLDSPPEEATDAEVSGDEVFKIVEEMPRFPGCEEMEQPQARDKCAQKRLLEFVYQNIKYPKTAKDAGTEGTVVVSLIIGPDGQVREYTIVRSVTPVLDEEVLRIAQLLQQEITWTPGVQDGKKVAVEFNLPVSFRLPEQSNKQEKEALEKISFSEQEAPVRLNGPDAPAKLIVFNRQGNVEVKDIKEMSDIDPEGIDRIHVLKGEKAIEKYGQDGANGVVEIYMKPGPSDIGEQPVAQTLQLQNFRASPNPTSGELRVRFKGEAVPTTLRILSITGQQLLQRPLLQFGGQADETLDLSNLPKGTVLLEVRQGERVYVEKVVVK
ncbi:MAG: TonB family protein [Phaeodactylibacter sp.]|uniref:TonB family protein n=1 Tax=Phaeodactylibacter sp. TaxID=1940289 RepID=UPI0032EEE952